MERVSSQIHIRESSSSAEKERFWKKRGMSIFPCKWYLDGYAFWSHSFAVLTFMSGLSKLFPHGNSSLYCLVFVFLKAKKWKSLNILHSVFFNSWFYSSQCSLCPGSLKMLFFFPPIFSILQLWSISLQSLNDTLRKEIIYRRLINFCLKSG